MGRLGGVLLVMALSGCVTREDIRGIQTDLYTIQQGIDTRLGNVKDQTEQRADRASGFVAIDSRS